MTQIINKSIGRRSFLKTSALAGGGLVVGFSWVTSCKRASENGALTMPEEWFKFNGYIRVGENGVVTIIAPNPEFGQNVKTSMPMIVAEELDVNWKNVIVEQAPFNAEIYTHTRQFTGGSAGIRNGWEGLRTAGAKARTMLRQAAANEWQVPVDEITTEEGFLHHQASGKKAGYGEIALAASQIPEPEKVQLKDVKNFKIIGNSKRNVDGLKMVTGKPMFGLDYKKEGMLIAMIVHPPAFGLKLKSFDGSGIKSMPGIVDVFEIKSLEDDYERNGFDTTTFTELVAIVGKST